MSHLRTRRPAANPSELDLTPNAAHSSNSEAPTSALWLTARDHLPDDAFTMLRLRYVEELSIAEIAQVVARSEVAVRVTLFRARKRLAELVPSLDHLESSSQHITSHNHAGISC